MSEGKLASAEAEPDTSADERAARGPDDFDTPVVIECSEALTLVREMNSVLNRTLVDAAACATGATAEASRALAAEHLAALRRSVHEIDDDDAPKAVCLSGGGIRSATFGLGVLQGLARTGWLAQFHYLSTVSGGGYIGSWLATWQSRPGCGDVPEQLKASAVGRLTGPNPQPQAKHPAPEPEPVRRLRAYSNYLSPALGVGGDLMSLVAIFGRNLFLHLSVLLPALLALLMVPRAYLALLGSIARMPPDGGAWAWWLLVALLVVALLALIQGGSVASLAFPALVGAALTLWGVLDGTMPGGYFFAVATLAIGVSIAYMAADLPELEQAVDPEAPPAPRNRLPPNRFVAWSLVPLIGASVFMTLLVPWLVEGGAAASIAAWLHGTCRCADDGAAPPVICRLGEDVAAHALLGILFAVAFGFLHVFAAFLGGWWRAARGLRSRNTAQWRSELLITFLIGAIGGIALLATAFGLWQLTRGPAPEAHLPLDALAGARELYAIVAVPAMLAVFWLTVTLYAGLTRRRKSEEDREWWARAAGLWILSGLAWCVLAAAVLLLPRGLLLLLEALGFDASGQESLAGGATLLGALTSAWGYWSRNSQKIVEQARGIAAWLNARLLEALSALFVVLLAGVLGLALSAGLERFPGAAATAPADASGVAWRVETLELERAAVDRQDRCVEAVARASVVSVKNRGPGTTSVSVPTLACAAAPLASTTRAAARFRGTLHATSATVAFGVCAALTALALGMAHLVGTNTFSLHSMYGNRLIRAYLGASNPPDRSLPHPFTGFDPGDNVELAALKDTRPFPVINAALNLVQPSGDRLEWQQRKAASFTFTPLACGSAVLGYAPTTHYGRKASATQGLSVGRAMAISGAAASPNMGYHSSVIVAFVMSFFNVRLGWWLPNTRVLPGRTATEEWARDEPPAAKTLWAETFARTKKDSEFVYLSDGGHFENIGLYEMVRRRCRRIVVVDATADANFGHADLLSSLRKIRVDFGISIEFPQGLPTAASCRRHACPWAIGRIYYGDADPDATLGSIVYLKPALWEGLPPDVLRYAQTSARKRGAPFPHQSTADQFFDEAQFESYRVLGLLTVLKAFGGRWPEEPGPDHREPAGPTSRAPRPQAPKAGGKAGATAGDGHA